MAREIKFSKFRAWDKYQKQFVTAKLEQGAAWTVSQGQHIRENMEPWEQYTGLKDKNGKEIYEGDIVFYSNFPASVIFKEGSFKFKPYGIGEELTISDMRTEFFHEIEVIGNIYENPELLKK